MARPEIIGLARAMRGSIKREHERRGDGRYFGIVESVDPLLVSVAGLEPGDLDEDDIDFGRALEKLLEVEPLEEEDTLVLIESGDDFVAVEVLRD